MSAPPWWRRSPSSVARWRRSAGCGASCGSPATSGTSAWKRGSPRTCSASSGWRPSPRGQVRSRPVPSSPPCGRLSASRAVLRLDNFYVLGGSAAATNERRQGLLPLLLHPAPRRAAFIGMATGITASAGAALGVDETTVIELVPEVARLAATEFATWNAQLLERPGVRLVVDDGRRYLVTTAERYDVVVGDLFIPWHAGAGSLYAREMFETVAGRLAPGGLFCQWLPLYQLTREEFDVIARTFVAVFPSVTLWRDDFYANRPIVALVGQVAPPTLDLGSLRERIAALPAWSD